MGYNAEKASEIYKTMARITRKHEMEYYQGKINELYNSGLGDENV